MRWAWIDQIIEFDRGRRMVAIKNVSRAEDHLHDHFPADDGQVARGVMPASLMIEGMAQTAGILVSAESRFQEKVILAKVVHAVFERDVFPGQIIRYDAVADRIDVQGASTHGEVHVLERPDAEWQPVGRISLLFSHIDRNRSGLTFPKENFVMSSHLRTIVHDSGIGALIELLD